MVIQEPEQLVKILRSYGKSFAFDTETVAQVSPGCISRGKKDTLVLDRTKAIILSFCGDTVTRKNLGCCVPLAEQYGPEFMSRETLVKVVRPFFEDPDVEVWAHNMNYDYNVMANEGLLIANPSCTLILAKLYDENLPGSLKDLSVLVGEILRKTKSIDFADLDSSAKYAEQDAVACWKLVRFFVDSPPDKFRPENRWLWGVQEKPLIPVIMQMERLGVHVDLKALRLLEKDVKTEIHSVVQKIFNTTGFSFNLNSPKQLSEVLYDKMGVPDPGTRSEKSKYSMTDEKTLFRLRDHEIVKLILEYRKLSKMSTTYLNHETGIASYCDAKGVIHPSFNQSGAVTGRMSCNSPNMQNIPARSALGKKIRRVFTAPKGHLAICFDYTMFELAILANFCAFLGKNRLDFKSLLCDTLSTGGDLHTATATTIGVARSIAKTINFGIIYGMGGGKLRDGLYMSGIEVELEEAYDYIDRFNKAYPEVNLYKKSVINFHKSNGYIKYLSGRVRRVEDLNSSNGKKRSMAERQVVNSPIQGTCADWLKQAMIRIHYDEKLIKWGVSQRLNVHDELLFYMPIRPYGNVLKALERIRVLMEQPPASPAFDVTVPIRVSGGVGPNWGDAKN